MGSATQRFLQAQLIQERRDQDAQREADLGKAAEYFFKGNPAALSDVGLTEDEFANLSARDQAAAAAGYMQKQTVDQITRRQQAEDSLANMIKQAGTSTVTGPGNVTNAAAPGIAPTLDRMLPPVTATAQVPIDAQRVMMALGQNPQAASSPNLDNLLRALEMQQRTKAMPSLGFNEDPVSGQRFATYGNILSPSGVNPARSSAAVPIVGPNGEDLGYGLPGKGGVTPLKTGQVTEQDQFRALMQKQRELVRAQAYEMDPQRKQAYQNQIDSVENDISGFMRQGAAPNAASPQGANATGLPKVTTQQEWNKLKPGAIYVGRDGKQYRKPFAK